MLPSEERGGMNISTELDADSGVTWVDLGKSG